MPIAPSPQISKSANDALSDSDRLSAAHALNELLDGPAPTIKPDASEATQVADYSQRCALFVGRLVQLAGQADPDAVKTPDLRDWLTVPPKQAITRLEAAHALRLIAHGIAGAPPLGEMVSPLYAAGLMLRRFQGPGYPPGLWGRAVPLRYGDSFRDVSLEWGHVLAEDRLDPEGVVTTPKSTQEHLGSGSLGGWLIPIVRAAARAIARSRIEGAAVQPQVITQKQEQPADKRPLTPVIDALSRVVIRAGILARDVDAMEAAYARDRTLGRDDFYVPTADTDTELHPEWIDTAPDRRQQVRRRAIDTTLMLRKLIDEAQQLVPEAASWMDGRDQPAADRWSTRTIRYLQDLRSAILKNHEDGMCPSALPMIRVGVPDALKEHAEHVHERMREAAAVRDVGDQRGVSPASVSADLLAQAVGRALEKVAPDLIASANAARRPLPATTQVVLWEGAEQSERTIRLARTRSAYLEAQGNVSAAMEALEKDGNPIGKSTFYDHLKALDSLSLGWRNDVLLSGASGNLENGVSVRTRRKSRDKGS